MIADACLLALIGPLGTTEVVVILVLALLFFGRRLPEVMRSMGRGVTEFKRGLNDPADDPQLPSSPSKKSELKKKAEVDSDDEDAD